MRPETNDKRETSRILHNGNNLLYFHLTLHQRDRKYIEEKMIKGPFFSCSLTSRYLFAHWIFFPLLCED